MKIEIIYGECFKGPQGQWFTDGLTTRSFEIAFGAKGEREAKEATARMVANTHVSKGRFVMVRPKFETYHPDDRVGTYGWESYDGEDLALARPYRT